MQVKMKCIRAHSSLVWGSPAEGEVFHVAPGYVRQLVDHGLAKLVDTPAVKPVTPDDVVAQLQATVTPPPITGKRRGRRR